jgi:hypothetical protein
LIVIVRVSVHCRSPTPPTRILPRTRRWCRLPSSLRPAPLSLNVRTIRRRAGIRTLARPMVVSLAVAAFAPAAGSTSSALPPAPGVVAMTCTEQPGPGGQPAVRPALTTGAPSAGVTLAGAVWTTPAASLAGVTVHVTFSVALGASVGARVVHGEGVLTGCQILNCVRRAAWSEWRAIVAAAEQHARVAVTAGESGLST